MYLCYCMCRFFTTVSLQALVKDAKCMPHGHYFWLTDLNKCSVGGPLWLLPPVTASHMLHFILCCCCHTLTNVSVSVHVIIVTRAPIYLCAHKNTNLQTRDIKVKIYNIATVLLCKKFETLWWYAQIGKSLSLSKFCMHQYLWNWNSQKNFSKFSFVLVEIAFSMISARISNVGKASKAL